MSHDPPPVRVPIADSAAELAVRRIFCVGRNYAEHAKEMGHSGREPPFFFGKAAEAVTLAGEVPYPPATRDLHHEIELVVAISRGGSGIEPGAAIDHVAGYAVGVDLTCR